MNSPNRTSVVILAAGASKRIRSEDSKLRLHYQGQSLLRRIVNTAISADIGPIFVVLGAYANTLQAELADLPVRAVINPAWASGIASSIRTGITAARQFAEPAFSVQGVLIMLADQPLITASDLTTIVRAAGSAALLAAAAQYTDGLGVPAWFAPVLLDQLASLQGDVGAKAILRRLSPDQVIGVPLQSSMLDIDTPEDFQHLTLQPDATKGPHLTTGPST